MGFSRFSGSQCERLWWRRSQQRWPANDQRDGTQDLVEGPPMAVTSSKLEAEAVVVVDKELQDLRGKKTWDRSNAELILKERQADEKALAEKFAEPRDGATLSCFLCGRQGFKGQFALSQHWWSKHEDHPEAALRSAYFSAQSRGKGASSSARAGPISKPGS